jgi:hypothetical protein
MIYIGTTETDGSAIYFDIYAVERQGSTVCFSGTLGDGSYEGEVLVELGDDCVTFADAWLRQGEHAAFIERCGGLPIETALLDSVREAACFRPRRRRPHTHTQSPQAALARESESGWPLAGGAANCC